MLTRTHYLHGLVFDDLVSAVDVFQLQNATPNQTFTELIESCASGYTPEYVGTLRSDPELTFDSTQIETLLAIMNDEFVSRDMTAGNTDLYYRAGKPLGTREDAIDSLHITWRLINSGYMYWRQIDATDGQTATIATTICTRWDGTNNPAAYLGSQQLVGECDVRQLYTLGPVKIKPAGGALTTVGGVTSVNFETGIELEKVPHGGEPFNSYIGIKMMTPRLTIQTHDLSWSQAIHAPVTPGGIAVDGWEFYLRKMDRTTIHVADATEEHIKFSGTLGLAQAPSNSGEPVAQEVTLTLEQPTGAPIFDVTLNTAIT